jgi:hypothetical protein
VVTLYIHTYFKIMYLNALVIAVRSKHGAYTEKNLKKLYLCLTAAHT